MTTLYDVLGNIINSGQESGKTPEQVRDEMVAELDRAIASLEAELDPSPLTSRQNPVEGEER